jgi:hypothetical protein
MKDRGSAGRPILPAIEGSHRREVRKGRSLVRAHEPQPLCDRRRLSLALLALTSTHLGSTAIFNGLPLQVYGGVSSSSIYAGWNRESLLDRLDGFSVGRRNRADRHPRINEFKRKVLPKRSWRNSPGEPRHGTPQPQL